MAHPGNGVPLSVALAAAKGQVSAMYQPSRPIKRLADLYALTADMLEDETGAYAWSAATERIGCTLHREESGITITTVDRAGDAQHIHYAEPGIAGDYLCRLGFGVGETWLGTEE